MAVSILDTIKADIDAALTGALRPAVYFSYEVTGDDGYGNETYGWNAHPCEGLRGSYQAELAGLSGIPRENSRVEILASSLDVVPQRAGVVCIENACWSILNVETDPATAMWLCEGQETTEPSL